MRLHSRSTARPTSFTATTEPATASGIGTGRFTDPSRQWMARSPNKAGYGATLAPHLRLLELGSGNRPVESGAQLLGCLQGQLNPRPRPGVKASVDKVEPR